MVSPSSGFVVIAYHSGYFNKNVYQILILALVPSFAWCLWQPRSSDHVQNALNVLVRIWLVSLDFIMQTPKANTQSQHQTPIPNANAWYKHPMPTPTPTPTTNAHAKHPCPTPTPNTHTQCQNLHLTPTPNIDTQCPHPHLMSKGHQSWSWVLGVVMGISCDLFALKCPPPNALGLVMGIGHDLFCT